MNIKEQENLFSNLLFEACQIMKQYDKSSLSEVEIFESSTQRLFESADLTRVDIDSYIGMTLKDNNYAKLKKIQKQILDIPLSIYKPLYESDSRVDFKNFNENTLRNMFEKTLSDMRKDNTVFTSTKDVLKIKRDLHLPLSVWGLNLNLVLKLEPNAYLLAYDFSMKKVIIVSAKNSETLNKISFYDIETDTLSDYNNTKIFEKMTKDNCFDMLKHNFNMNLKLIYIDVNQIDAKFTESVFKEVTRYNFYKKQEEENQKK